jgi:hypothetical protein
MDRRLGGSQNRSPSLKSSTSCALSRWRIKLHKATWESRHNKFEHFYSTGQKFGWFWKTPSPYIDVFRYTQGLNITGFTFRYLSGNKWSSLTNLHSHYMANSLRTYFKVERKRSMILSFIYVFQAFSEKIFSLKAIFIRAASYGLNITN